MAIQLTSGVVSVEPYARTHGWIVKHETSDPRLRGRTAVGSPSQ